MMLWGTVSVIIVALVLCDSSTKEKDHIFPLEKSSLWYNNGSRVQQLSSSSTCPETWFVPTDNGSCECGITFYDIVVCDSETKDVKVEDCYCITFDPTSEAIVLGQCLFNCINVSKSYYDYIYHSVPRDIVSGDDNNSVCGYLHRNGTLCGQCAHGYYPAAYSYTFECITCNTSHHLLPNWMWYSLVAYTPLTFFIVFIFVFRVSVVSPELYGVISILQTVASPLNIRTLAVGASYDYAVNRIFQVSVTLLSIWNLDFFRTLVPGICLEITSLQVLALDYLIAIYPMAVTVIAFILFGLHNCGFKPIMVLFKPFHRIFARFRQEWNLRTSLIDAFITFFLLSTTKLFCVSVNFLVSVALYAPNGQITDIRLYEDANIEYFGAVHYPYGILALLVSFLLILLPIALLLFYNTTCCQRCLVKTKLKSYLLQEFMDAFNRYYKDGSNGTIDCRWFAAFYIINRLGFYLMLFFPITSLFYNLALMYTLLCAAVVLLVEPYKEEYKLHNVIEPCFLLVQACFLAGITGANASAVMDSAYIVFMLMFSAVVTLLPIAYLGLITIWWILRQTPIFYRKQNLIPDLPDRLLNSQRYTSFAN